MDLGRSAALMLANGRFGERQGLTYISIVVYQGTSSAGKVILLKHCDIEASLCEAGCCRYSANTSA